MAGNETLSKREVGDFCFPTAIAILSSAYFHSAVSVSSFHDVTRVDRNQCAPRKKRVSTGLPTAQQGRFLTVKELMSNDSTCDVFSVVGGRGGFEPLVAIDNTQFIDCGRRGHFGHLGRFDSTETVHAAGLRESMSVTAI